MGLDQPLAPEAWLLAAGFVLDALFGDPQYAWHPIRLIGRTLAFFETILRACGLAGYGGGCTLFLLLALVWGMVPSAGLVALNAWNPYAALVAHVFIVYTFLALRDLIDHVRAVGKAADSGHTEKARRAIAMLVGRDVTHMDGNACRRAAIESLSENFVDGVVSPIFWYVLGGIPGLLLFKVASTMDSMVGYKTARYLRFGWCGARLDDVMNYVPARLTWALLGLVAFLVPGASAIKGWRIGMSQHGILPGPNPGWSEATIAGALQRRLIGPIWKDGELVTEIWLGDAGDPEGGNSADLRRAIQLVVLASAVIGLIAVAVLL